MSKMLASIGRDMRSLALVPVLLLCSSIAFGQSPQLKSGASIYIEPMGGYETYLSAALMKKNVPLVIVTQKNKADYIISGSAVHVEPGHPATVVNNTASASINNNDGNPAFQRGFAAGLAGLRAQGAAKVALGYSDHFG